MFRKGYVLFCLLVASLLMTTVVHARELPGQAVFECSGASSDEPDEHPASGETGKAAAGHHGCHGASSFLPAGFQGSPVFYRVAARYPLTPVDALACASPGAVLRPPIA